MPKNIAFLINPAAGGGKKSKVKEYVISKLNSLDIPYQFFPTNAEGLYPELESRILSGEFTDVVIIGGDGSIRNVVSALRHTHVRFGIIPQGSGNGLAFTAGIPRDFAKALQIIIEGWCSPVDSLMVNGVFSCMLSGIGFDAKVAHEFSESPRRGLKTYFKISLKNFFSARPYPFRIHVDGKTTETEAYFISIANSNQFGNQFTIAPKAKLNDGLLDVVVVQKMSKLQLILSVIQQIRYGDIRENIFKKHCILYFQTSEFKVDNPGKAPFHIDGDPAATSDSFSVSVIPEAFQLIQPYAG